MTETREIHNALARLSCIEDSRFHYDPTGQIYGEGEIHYLVEVRGLFLMVWENGNTKTMIVNPLTHFDLDELGELGAEEAWTVLRVPALLEECIQFHEMSESELVDAYRRMEEWSPKTDKSGVLQVLEA